MNKRSWKKHLGAVALVIAIVFVLNPELRALVLIVDAIGLDVVLLLVAAQSRAIWPVLQTATAPLLIALCRFSSSIARAAMQAFPRLLPFRRLGVLLCPLLFVLSYGVRC